MGLLQCQAVEIGISTSPSSFVPAGYYPYQHQRTLAALPVLPPVRGTVSYPFTHNLPSPHTTSSQPFNYPAIPRQPPSYEQAEADQGSFCPYQHLHVQGEVVLKSRKEEDDSNIAAGEMEDSSQYLSKEEIHVAAMEGVKTSRLRNLVL